MALTALGFSSIFFNWVSATFLHASVDVKTMTAAGINSTFIMGAITAVIPVFLMMYINSYLKKRDA